jgi:hypothetical protein
MTSVRLSITLFLAALISRSDGMCFMISVLIVFCCRGESLEGIDTKY